MQQYDLVTQQPAFSDPTLAENDIEVYHDHIQTNYVNVFGTKAYMVFKGSELATDAQAYHAFPDLARRLNATHDLMMGQTLVRVHPGVGIVLLLDASSGPVEIKCVRNCPQPLDFYVKANYSLQAPGSPGEPIGATNATKATAPTLNVNGDGPTQKQAPGPALGLVLAGGALAALLAARRRR
jgi:hypothetical protein